MYVPDPWSLAGWNSNWLDCRTHHWAIYKCAEKESVLYKEKKRRRNEMKVTLKLVVDKRAIEMLGSWDSWWEVGNKKTESQRKRLKERARCRVGERQYNVPSFYPQGLLVVMYDFEWWENHMNIWKIKCLEKAFVVKTSSGRKYKTPEIWAMPEHKLVVPMSLEQKKCRFINDCQHNSMSLWILMLRGCGVTSSHRMLTFFLPIFVKLCE